MIAGFALGLASVLPASRIVHRGRSPFLAKAMVAAA